MSANSRQSSTKSTLPPYVNYRLLRIANEQFGKVPAKLDESERKRVSNIAAREYLLEQVILASNEAKGIVVPPSQVELALDQIRQRYESEEQFEYELSENNLQLEDLREALQRELRVDSVVARVEAGAPAVEDTDVDLFYYLNRDKFNQPELRCARHILITINPDFAENTAEAAFQRLAQIRKRLVKNPRRFEEQAMKHSECPTALNGGLLGDVKPGELFEKLDQTLFAMQPGQMSDILASPIGLHILRCEAIREAGMAPLDDIFSDLRQRLQVSKARRHSRQWIQQLMKQASDESGCVDSPLKPTKKVSV